MSDFAESAGGEAPQPAPAERDEASRRRRRGSRGGRNRSRTTSGADIAGTNTGDDNQVDERPAPATAAGDRVRGADRSGGGPAVGASRAGRSAADTPEGVGRGPDGPTSAEPARKPRIGDTRPAPDAPAPAVRPARGGGASSGNGGPAGGSAGGSTGTSGRRRRRRGGRRRGGAGAGAGSAGASTGGGSRRAGAAGSARAHDLSPEDLDNLRGRERKGRPVGRYLMAVHVRPGATQIAVMEGRALIEHYVSRPQDDVTQIDGNIYVGRVQNVLPGMEAAFVDIGTPKNAVLYRGDVRYDKDDVVEGGPARSDARIEQLLRPGQTILCQVTKNPIGTKGARLTQEVSLPGRFVVLIPNSSTYGISKRLGDDERKRLRRVLDEVKPPGHGIIVRTAAEGVSADELQRDVIRLLKQWDDIDSRQKRSKAPALLYREPDMAVRVIREEFNRHYRGVVIDDRALYEEVHDYVASISPDLADRVEYYDHRTDPLPIFERFHVHEQLHKALDRKVWLPSGGSLIIERTEALTVIDVNTGKNVGTSNLEETVYRNNLEAAEEIARQLRLRDIGGIIVIDFIDMEIRRNREDVIGAFRDALSRDKTRTQVFDISELGLVEMTRKRVSEGLVESFSTTCPVCAGRGIVLDEDLL